MKTDMRVAVSKRMLREGMLRCLEARPLSKISVSKLCRESGINRTTFYNHYDSPAMIVKEIALEYADQFLAAYESGNGGGNGDDRDALEACFAYFDERRAELRVLFSDHAENYLAGVTMEIVNDFVARNAPAERTTDQQDLHLLRAAASAGATFALIHAWLTLDIKTTPRELVAILGDLRMGR